MFESVHSGSEQDVAAQLLTCVIEACVGYDRDGTWGRLVCRCTQVLFLNHVGMLIKYFPTFQQSGVTWFSFLMDSILSTFASWALLLLCVTLLSKSSSVSFAVYYCTCFEFFVAWKMSAVMNNTYDLYQMCQNMPNIWYCFLKWRRKANTLLEISLSNVWSDSKPEAIMYGRKTDSK